MPPLGSGRIPVDLPARIVNVGVVESTCQATSAPITLDGFCSNEVARLSLLNGLIKADAVTAIARITKLGAPLLGPPPTEYPIFNYRWRW